MPATSLADTESAAANAFIARWQGVTYTNASKLASPQSFVTELCALLGVPAPLPSGAQDYQFERPITFQHGDASTSAGRIDCYRRNHFVWESKKLRDFKAPSRRFDAAMLTARAQAEGYARALPATEGRPPFLLVADVGHVIEVYAEFTRTGATYTPYPDLRNHRIALADLARPAVRQQLGLIWTDPDALNPARVSACVTREVAAHLADLAKPLEHSGHRADHVAALLSRCLFSMFAEDVELLPKGSFLNLLRSHREQPATARQMMRILWSDMDRGGFSAALARQVLHFNGRLFKEPESDNYALLLDQHQLDKLIAAAQANWREVEPAIFGTLLERALDPAERHTLSAHDTPRAYVERLLLPTVVEPLRADWANAQAASLVLAEEAAELKAHPPSVVNKDDFVALDRHHAAVRAKWKEARQQVKDFHHALCSVRVLDPACGSGNFLYVTLEHLKRLEGEVLNQLDVLGAAQQDSLAFETETVNLQQLLGIEINERAAALAELVLWIGYLQWQIRTQGNKGVAEPVVHDYGNISCRDAVLAWDDLELAYDTDNKLLTQLGRPHFHDPPRDRPARAQRRRRGAAMALHPSTQGRLAGRAGLGSSPPTVCARPSIGGWCRRRWMAAPGLTPALCRWCSPTRPPLGGQRQWGGGAERDDVGAKAGDELSRSSDDLPLLPDDSARRRRVKGALVKLLAEEPGENGEVMVKLSGHRGEIHADLTVGANVANAHQMLANCGLTSRGVMLFGAGFIVSADEASSLGAGAEPDVERRIRDYGNGRDLTDRPRGAKVIDLFGLSVDECRARYTRIYQHVLDRIKPERDANRDPAIRENWWIHGRVRQEMRRARSPACPATSPPSKPRNTAPASFSMQASFPTQYADCDCHQRCASFGRVVQPGAHRMGACSRWTPWGGQRPQVQQIPLL